MAIQTYQLLSGDSEKGDNAYPLPAGHTGYLLKKAASSPGNILMILSAIGAFFSGVIVTLAIITIRSESSGMGQYETGFREEKLCKSDYIFFFINYSMWTDLKSQNSAYRINTVRTSAVQISSRFREGWARVSSYESR